MSAGGNWVTINGVHILIGGDGKTIMKGPAKFIGSTVSEMKNATSGKNNASATKERLLAKKKAKEGKSGSKAVATPRKKASSKVDVTKPMSKDTISKMSDEELKSAYDKASGKITTYADGSYTGGLETLGNTIELGRELSKRGIEHSSKQKSVNGPNMDYINGKSEMGLLQMAMTGDNSGKPFPRNVQEAIKKRLNDFDNDDDHLRNILKGQNHNFTILNEKSNSTKATNKQSQITKGMTEAEKSKYYNAKAQGMSDSQAKSIAKKKSTSTHSSTKVSSSKASKDTKSTTSRKSNPATISGLSVVHYDGRGKSWNEYNLKYSDGTTKRTTLKNLKSMGYTKDSKGFIVGPDGKRY